MRKKKSTSENPAEWVRKYQRRELFKDIAILICLFLLRIILCSAIAFIVTVAVHLLTK